MASAKLLVVVGRGGGKVADGRIVVAAGETFVAERLYPRQTDVCQCILQSLVGLVVLREEDGSVYEIGIDLAQAVERRRVVLVLTHGIHVGAVGGQQSANCEALPPLPAIPGDKGGQVGIGLCQCRRLCRCFACRHGECYNKYRYYLVSHSPRSVTCRKHP